MTRAQLLGAAAAVLLPALGCAPVRGPWSVSGNVSREVAAQAIALTDAAKRVYPGPPLDRGGHVALLPEVGSRCFPSYAGPRVITGCPVQGGVLILWPHPKCPPPADLTCSALAHELAHVAGAGTEAAADAGAALVVQAWRKAQP